MKIASLTIALGLTAALLGGCKKKEETPSTDTSAPIASASATAAATPTIAPIPTPTMTATAKPVTNDADAGAIRSCCAALHRAAGSESNPTTKAKLTAAAGVCDGEIVAVQRGAVTRAGALSSIRANNGGKPLPAGCN